VSHDDFLQIVADVLENHEIPYMITGSVAGSSYGLTRSTQDIDIVIETDADQLLGALGDLPEDVYFDANTIRAETKRLGMFNIISVATGWKVDFILRKNREFSRTEFARRRRVEVGERSIFVVSPEDSILSKLEWYAKSGSTRQLEDCVKLFENLNESIDRVYLNEWAEKLGIKSELDRLLDQVNQIDS